MKLFKCVKNNVVTNLWDDAHGLDENHYEVGFGKPLRWVREGDEDISGALGTREVDGIDGPITEYQLAAEFEIQIEDIGNAQSMAKARVKRNAILTACDWTQLADCPLDSGKKTEWAAYRQALRALPQSDGFDPDNIVWPTQP